MYAKEMLFLTASNDEIHTLLVDTVNSVVRRNLNSLNIAEKEPQDSPDKLLSKKEAAHLLNCSTSTIDNYAREGILTRFYIGRAVRFRRDNVLAIPSLKKKG